MKWGTTRLLLMVTFKGHLKEFLRRKLILHHILKNLSYRWLKEAATFHQSTTTTRISNSLKRVQTDGQIVIGNQRIFLIMVVVVCSREHLTKATQFAELRHRIDRRSIFYLTIYQMETWLVIEDKDILLWCSISSSQDRFDLLIIITIVLPMSIFHLLEIIKVIMEVKMVETLIINTQT